MTSVGIYHYIITAAPRSQLVPLSLQYQILANRWQSGYVVGLTAFASNLLWLEAVAAGKRARGFVCQLCSRYHIDAPK